MRRMRKINEPYPDMLPVQLSALLPDVSIRVLRMEDGIQLKSWSSSGTRDAEVIMTFLRFCDGQGYEL